MMILLKDFIKESYNEKYTFKNKNCNYLIFLKDKIIFNEKEKDNKNELKYLILFKDKIYLNKEKKKKEKTKRLYKEKINDIELKELVINAFSEYKNIISEIIQNKNTFKNILINSNLIFKNIELNFSQNQDLLEEKIIDIKKLVKIKKDNNSFLYKLKKYLEKEFKFNYIHELDSFLFLYFLNIYIESLFKLKNINQNQYLQLKKNVKFLYYKLFENIKFYIVNKYFRFGRKRKIFLEKYKYIEFENVEKRIEKYINIFLYKFVNLNNYLNYFENIYRFYFSIRNEINVKIKNIAKNIYEEDEYLININNKIYNSNKSEEESKSFEDILYINEINNNESLNYINNDILLKIDLEKILEKLNLKNDIYISDIYDLIEYIQKERNNKNLMKEIKKII